MYACVCMYVSKVFVKAYVNPVLTKDKLFSLTFNWLCEFSITVYMCEITCIRICIWVWSICNIIIVSAHLYIPSKLLLKQMFKYKISYDLWCVFKLKILSAFLMKFVIFSKGLWKRSTIYSSNKVRFCKYKTIFWISCATRNIFCI